MLDQPRSEFATLIKRLVRHRADRAGLKKGRVQREGVLVRAFPATFDWSIVSAATAKAHGYMFDLSSILWKERSHFYSTLHVLRRVLVRAATNK